MSVALVVPKHYTPREQFSPSGLELLAQCGHKWGLRYIRGIKEKELPNWEEVCHLVRPPKPKPGDSYHRAAMLRDEVKEYNRLTRRALGQALHFVCTVHYDWHPPLREVQWDDRPAVLFMAGLHLLPNPDYCETLWLEEELSFDVGPANDPLKIWGFIDSVVRFAKQHGGRWRLYDLKSTYDFGYCKTPDELRDDVQACFYALALMIEQGLYELECRWVYFLTDETKRPDARGVDFAITREHAERVLRPHFRRALEARQAMRAGPRERRTLPVLAQNILSCDTFGGCLHKDTEFCRPKAGSKGAVFAAAQAQKDTLRKRREALKDAPPSPARPSAHHAPKKDTSTRMGNRFKEQLANETGGGDDPEDVETPNDAPAAKPARRARTSAPSDEAPAPRRNAAPKGKPAASSTEAPSEVTVTVDGVTFKAPAGTPLHRRAVAVANALYSE